MPWKTTFFDSDKGLIGQQDSRGKSIYQVFALKGAGEVNLYIGGQGSGESARLAIRYHLFSRKADVWKTSRYTLEDVRIAENVLYTLGCVDSRKVLSRCRLRAIAELKEKEKGEIGSPSRVAPKDRLEDWISEGKEQGATHLIVVEDTVVHEDFPIFVSEVENVDEVFHQYHGQNMQEVIEVYDLRKDTQTQLGEKRAFHVS